MPRILIVDDESMVRDVVSTLLKQAGYDVTIAEYGLTGYSMAQTGQPDLVLLDLMMPVVDGFEVLRRLKNDPSTRHIPVIMLTAKINAASERECMRLGAVDYIKKPWGPRELEERIGMALGYPELTPAPVPPNSPPSSSNGGHKLEIPESPGPSESHGENASGGNDAGNADRPPRLLLQRFRTTTVVIPEEGETEEELNGQPPKNSETGSDTSAEALERPQP